MQAACQKCVLWIDSGWATPFLLFWKTDTINLQSQWGPFKRMVQYFLPSYCRPWFSHLCLSDTSCTNYCTHLCLQPNIYANISVSPQKKNNKKSPDYVNLRTARSYKSDRQHPRWAKKKKKQPLMLISYLNVWCMFLMHCYYIFFYLKNKAEKKSLLQFVCSVSISAYRYWLKLIILQNFYWVFMFIWDGTVFASHRRVRSLLTQPWSKTTNKSWSNCSLLTYLSHLVSRCSTRQ